MSELRQKAIVVVGMHRSGTSPITRGLKALGIELGEDLMEPVPDDNPTGFWEFKPIYELNERILAAIGKSWNSVGLIDSTVWQRPEMKSFKLEAVQILRTGFGNTSMWGFKDPRTARLLPFWQSIFEHLDVDVSYLLIVRNPISVVKSLSKRNGLAPEKSYLLWLEHSLAAFNCTHGKPRVVVDYDEFLRSPSDQLLRIAKTLSLPSFSSAEESIKEYEHGFLNPELRHTAYQALDVFLDDAAPEIVARSYQIFRRVALDEIDIESTELSDFLKSAQTTLDGLGTIYSYVDRLNNDLDKNHQLVSDLEQSGRQTSEEIARLQARHSDLEATHSALSGRYAALETEYTELLGQYTALETHHRGLLGQHTALQTEHTGLLGQHGALATEHTRLLGEHAALNAAHSALSDQNSALETKYFALQHQKSDAEFELGNLRLTLQLVQASPGWNVIERYRGWVERQRSRHPRLFSRYERAALWWLRKMAGLPRDYPRAEVAEEGSPASQLSAGSSSGSPGENSDELIAEGAVVDSTSTTPEVASAAPGLWAVEHSDEAKQNMRNFFATRLGVFLATDNSLILPRAEQPEVSIILVLHNQAQLTFGCFSSIAECLGTSALGVEVMVVDNYSTDETNALLQHTRGSTVLYNDENVGFLKAVNQAASQAHGRYILLLNNDAQLLPGSLEAAARVLDSSPDVGAVGGRLILPDGTLQEAGSIVWNDGSCLGYGRGDSPTAGPYMFRRNVDYCSGAFLLTRAELFTRLGGFDEAFVPAYYEETDYCMRLWEAGFRVVYEPEAVVLHYEFGSAEKVSGALELQQAHRAVFAARHAERLRGHFAPSPSYVLCARTSGNRYERILMIEDVIPHSWLGAGLPRSARIIRELMGAGALVTFFPMVLQADEWRNIRATVPPEVEVILEYGIGKIERFLEERRGFYGTILVCRPHNMRAFMEVVRRRPDLTEGAALVYDAEAFFAMREILERRLRGEPLEQAKVEAMLAEEASLAGAAQLVLSVSPHECAEFRRLGVDNVEVLGNLLDPAPGQESFAARRGLLFVGRLNEDGSPNVDGLCWFVRDILPLVQKALDHEVHLTVAGANGAPSLSGLNGTSVTMLGQVKDLSPIYNAARVFIAPTRFAAGIPLKVHEAAAHGIPVVATPLLAEQLGWRDGEELLVAGDAPEFAAQCARLYRDETLWTRLRMNAIDRIREDCSPVRFRKTIARIVDATRTHAAPAK